MLEGTLARWKDEVGLLRTATIVPAVSLADERRSWCGGGGLFVARNGLIVR